MDPHLSLFHFCLVLRVWDRKLKGKYLVHNSVHGSWICLLVKRISLLVGRSVCGKIALCTHDTVFNLENAIFQVVGVEWFHVSLRHFLLDISEVFTEFFTNLRDFCDKYICEFESNPDRLINSFFNARNGKTNASFQSMVSWHKRMH